MPWLMERVEEQLVKVVRGRTVMDGIMRDVVRVRCEAFNKLEEKIRQERLAQNAAQQLQSQAATPVPPPAEEQVVSLANFLSYRAFVVHFEMERKVTCSSCL